MTKRHLTYGLLSILIRWLFLINITGLATGISLVASAAMVGFVLLPWANEIGPSGSILIDLLIFLVWLVSVFVIYTAPLLYCWTFIIKKWRCGISSLPRIAALLATSLVMTIYIFWATAAMFNLGSDFFWQFVALWVVYPLHCLLLAMWLEAQKKRPDGMLRDPDSTMPWS